MPKALVGALCLWLFSTAAGGGLMRLGNISWTNHEPTSVFEVAAWTIGCLLIVGGMIAPGFVAARRSLNSERNLLKMAAVMGSPFFLFVVFGQQLSIISTVIMAVLLWALFSGVCLGFLWFGARLACRDVTNR